MVAENNTLSTSTGKLSYVLSRPTSDYLDLAVICCHGSGSDKNTETFLRLEKDLGEKVALFRFDFYAHGASEGNFLSLTPSLATQNIIDSYNYLIRLGFKRIALLGSSFGGYCALAASHKLEKLSFLLLRCPAIYFTQLPEVKNELEKWRENGFVEWFSKKGMVKVGYGFYEDLLEHPLDLETPLRQPTHIVHGTADIVVPSKDSEKFCKAHPEVKLLLVSDADHRFSTPEAFESMIRYTENVILQHDKYG